MPIIGTEIVEARANDLVALDMSHPEPAVWLVRPRDVLPPGEYALMLGTEMMAIFPFTVTATAKGSPLPAPAKP